MGDILGIPPRLLLVQLFNGLVFGLILALLSLGLSLTFGLTGVVNFAHGSLYMIGAYIAYTVISTLGGSSFGSFTLAIILAGVGVGVIGLCMELLLLRPIYDRNLLLQVLTMFAAAIIIRGIVITIFGRTGLKVSTPDALSQSSEVMDGVFLSHYRLFLAAFSLVLIASLWAFLTYTDYGVQIRAAAYDFELVNAMGVDVEKLLTINFVLGAILAGVAGTLAAPLFSANPSMDFDILILLFVAVVIGGFGSFKGGFYGAVLVGMMVTTGQVFLPENATLATYMLMIIVLLSRERGLFGVELEGL